MDLTMSTNYLSKLEELAGIEGYECSEDMLSNAIIDSVCPGICINEDCSYTTEVEPDQSMGYCENCGTQTVVSAMILAGVI
jgi:hypothetical protein